jgi:amino acid adenylation domain-containing protein
VTEGVGGRVPAATLPGLLERAAARRPDGPAVIDADRSISYRELDQAANRLAATLRQHGLRRGDRVGIYAEKSIEAVVAVYAVMKAGGAYVPLDTTAPAVRLATIAADCGVRLLISSQKMAAQWPALISGGAALETIVCLDEPPASTMRGVIVTGGRALEGAPAAPPAEPVFSFDLAYLLYTSGSTGVPKGVKLTHRNCLAFVSWAARQLELTPDDRLSSHAPFHFDLSTFDLFGAAFVAAPVVLVPPRASVFPAELVRFIDQAGITVWYSVPSILTLMATRGGLRPGALPRLRIVLFAGEVFPTKHLRALQQQLPHARLCNLFGPTETNVCTWYDVAPIPDDATEPIPIGRAIDDVELIVVTPQGTPAGVGEVGELLVRGPTVMQGYWGDAERSQRVLVRHPFDTEASDLLYRTGDLVQRTESGELRFLGRSDHQIKSRGYRIELGDIEAALDGHPSVIECVAVARPDELFGNRLEAVAVVRGDVTGADLVAFCTAVLPKYMVPEAIHVRAALPRTSTGKIDRRTVADELHV